MKRAKSTFSQQIERILGPPEREPIPKEWKLIGFFDSPETNSKLTLLAAAIGLDKSKLLRKIVVEWMVNYDVVQMTVKKIRWLKSSPEGDAMPLREFKAKIREFLVEKKVSEDLIQKVLKDIL